MVKKRINVPHSFASLFSFVFVLAAILLQGQIAHAIIYASDVSPDDLDENGYWRLRDHFSGSTIDETIWINVDGFKIDMTYRDIITDDDFGIVVHANNVRIISYDRSIVQSTSHVGLHALEKQNLYLNRLELKGKNFGLHIMDFNGGDFRDVVARGTDYDGIWVQDSNDMAFTTGTQASSEKRHGLVIYGGDNNTLIDCRASGSTKGYGFVMYETTDYHLYACHATRNIHGFLFVDADNDPDEIDGEVEFCAAYDNSQYGFVDIGKRSKIINYHEPPGQHNYSRDNHNNDPYYQFYWEWYEPGGSPA